MGRLGLAGRLYLINGLGFALSLSIVGFLLHRIGAIQGAYETALTTQVRQLDQARLLEVSLRWQVQEWKDILLRYDQPVAQAKHRQACFAKEAERSEGLPSITLASPLPLTRMSVWCASLRSAHPTTFVQWYYTSERCDPRHSPRLGTHDLPPVHSHAIP